MRKHFGADAGHQQYWTRPAHGEHKRAVTFGTIPVGDASLTKSAIFGHTPTTTETHPQSGFCNRWRLSRATTKNENTRRKRNNNDHDHDRNSEENTKRKTETGDNEPHTSTREGTTPPPTPPSYRNHHRDRRHHHHHNCNVPSSTAITTTIGEGVWVGAWKTA